MSARVLWDKIHRALKNPLRIPTKLVFLKLVFLKCGKELRCHGRIADYDDHNNET